MGIQESGEMYLENILILSEKGKVRSVDIAEFMNFSKPSISRAMGILRNDGYIEIDSNGYITLTESGLGIAEKIYERHRVLSALLIKIGVSEDVATEDACRVEHFISDETFQAIKRASAKLLEE